MNARILVGDCRQRMAEMEENSIDAIVCDPPYGLEFMGKEWDKLGAAALNDPSVVGGFQDGGGGNAFSRSRIRFGRSARSMQAWHNEWAVEALRVARPGAHLLAFGGTRTHHRLMCAIEDAGWEIRDCLSWLYGSGFPKSLDVSKAIDKAAGAEREITREELRPLDSGEVITFDQRSSAERERRDVPATAAAAAWKGWGTALKPAWEPIVLARKPLAGSVAGNVLAHGTGALNIDGCRIGTTVETWPSSRNYSAKEMSRPGSTLASDAETQRTGPTPPGRWPANLILDEEAAAALDQQSGERTSGARKTGEHQPLGMYANAIRSRPPGMEREMPALDASAGGASRFFFVSKNTEAETARCLNWVMAFRRDCGCADEIAAAITSEAADSGGASRFFYTAKASNADRNDGLEGRGLLRLKSDLTDEQRAYVTTRLREAGIDV